MNKANRILFDITCIVVILILPYFMLEKLGIVDFVRKLEVADEKSI